MFGMASNLSPSGVFAFSVSRRRAKPVAEMYQTCVKTNPVCVRMTQTGLKYPLTQTGFVLTQV